MKGLPLDWTIFQLSDARHPAVKGASQQKKEKGPTICCCSAFTNWTTLSTILCEHLYWESAMSRATYGNSEINYGELLNSLNAIVWRADARTLKTTFVNKQAEKILGHTVHSWLEKPNFWIDHIHP